MIVEVFIDDGHITAQILIVEVFIDDGHITAHIFLAQWHSEVGWAVPFSAVFRFPVIDQYP